MSSPWAGGIRAWVSRADDALRDALVCLRGDAGPPCQAHVRQLAPGNLPLNLKLPCSPLKPVKVSADLMQTIAKARVVVDMQQLPCKRAVSLTSSEGLSRTNMSTPGAVHFKVLTRGTGWKVSDEQVTPLATSKEPGETGKEAQLRQLLIALLRTVLREQPDDPYACCADHFQCRSESAEQHVCDTSFASDPEEPAEGASVGTLVVVEKVTGVPPGSILCITAWKKTFWLPVATLQRESVLHFENGPSGLNPLRFDLMVPLASGQVLVPGLTRALSQSRHLVLSHAGAEVVVVLDRSMKGPQDEAKTQLAMDTWPACILSEDPAQLTRAVESARNYLVRHKLDTFLRGILEEAHHRPPDDAFALAATRFQAAAQAAGKRTSAEDARASSCITGRSHHASESESAGGELSQLASSSVHGIHSPMGTPRDHEHLATVHNTDGEDMSLVGPGMGRFRTGSAGGEKDHGSEGRNQQIGASETQQSCGLDVLDDLMAIRAGEQKHAELEGDMSGDGRVPYASANVTFQPGLLVPSEANTSEHHASIELGCASGSTAEASQQAHQQTLDHGQEMLQEDLPVGHTTAAASFQPEESEFRGEAFQNEQNGVTELEFQPALAGEVCTDDNNENVVSAEGTQDHAHMAHDADAASSPFCEHGSGGQQGLVERWPCAQTGLATDECSQGNETAQGQKPSHEISEPSAPATLHPEKGTEAHVGQQHGLAGLQVSLQGEIPGTEQDLQHSLEIGWQVGDTSAAATFQSEDLWVAHASNENQPLGSSGQLLQFIPFSNELGDVADKTQGTAQQMQLGGHMDVQLVPLQLPSFMHAGPQPATACWPNAQEEPEWLAAAINMTAAGASSWTAGTASVERPSAQLTPRLSHFVPEPPAQVSSHVGRSEESTITPRLSCWIPISGH